MENAEIGLKSAIKNATTFVRETASKSEAAALDAVTRAETAFAGVQAKLSDAREFGNEVAESLGHAGRTSINGVAEFNGALGRYGKDALNDTIEFGRQTLKAKSLKELVELNVGFVAKRSQAMFASVSELNAIAQAKTAAAWSPFGETLRKAGEKATAQA